MLTVQPQLDRIKAQHTIDREMLTDITEERNIFERIEPFGIVEHYRIGRAVAESQEPLENPFDRRNVFPDQISRQHLARFVLEAWVTNLARAATHQNNRFMSSLLHPPKQHDLNQAAYMKRWRSRIEADIARDNLV